MPQHELSYAGKRVQWGSGMQVQRRGAPLAVASLRVVHGVGGEQVHQPGGLPLGRRGQVRRAGQRLLRHPPQPGARAPPLRALGRPCAPAQPGSAQGPCMHARSHTLQTTYHSTRPYGLCIPQAQDYSWTLMWAHMQSTPSANERWAGLEDPGPWVVSSEIAQGAPLIGLLGAISVRAAPWATLQE